MALIFFLILYLILTIFPVLLLPRRLGVTYGRWFAAISLVGVPGSYFWALTPHCGYASCMAMPVISVLLIPGLLFNIGCASIRNMNDETSK